MSTITKPCCAHSNSSPTLPKLFKSFKLFCARNDHDEPHVEAHRCPFQKGTGCCKLPMQHSILDYLRTHERDFDIRLHDFLVPATLLFGAVGVANSSFLKMLVCLLGVATTGLWLYRIWWWTSLSLIDRRTASVAGMFACAWLVTFLVQLKNVFSLR